MSKTTSLIKEALYGKFSFLMYKFGHHVAGHTLFGITGGPWGVLEWYTSNSFGLHHPHSSQLKAVLAYLWKY